MALRFSLVFPVFLLVLAGCVATESGREGAIDGAILAEAREAAAEGRHGQAAAHLAEIHHRRPGDAEIAIAYMDALRRAGAYREAYRVAWQSREIIADEPDFFLAAAKAEIAAGHPEEALQSLDKAKNTRPRDWEVYSLNGIANDALGRFDAAWEAYGTALELSPDNPVVVNNMALSLAQVGNLDQAMVMLSRMVGHGSGGSVVLRQNLALLHGFKGNLDDFEALARLDLTDEMVKKNLEMFRILRRTAQ